MILARALSRFPDGQYLRRTRLWFSVIDSDSIVYRMVRQVTDSENDVYSVNPLVSDSDAIDYEVV